MTETLNILENFAPLPPAGSAEYSHLLAESCRRAFIDRNDEARRPGVREESRSAELTSKAYAKKLAAQIDPHHASKTPVFDAEGRGDEHDALLGGRRDGQRRRDDDDAERRLRLRRVGSRRRVLHEQRDGRLRRAARNAEHVRARAGRSERDPARASACSRRWIADDRARSRRASCCWSPAPPAARRSSRRRCR